MKRIFKILALAATAVMTASCYEDYVHDYDFPNMGFALPKQVRTVMSKTNRIYVGVSIGGKRQVDMNDWAQFILDESLLEGTPYKMMPENYYRLANPTLFQVRKSNLQVADVEITFTNDFYADPDCLKATYALPFRLVGCSIDAPDAKGNVSERGALREGAQTAVVAIKYSSSYSGTYYRLTTGVTEIDADGNAIGETEDLSNSDFIKNPTVVLKSLGASTLSFEGLAGGKTAGTMTLDIDPSKKLDEDAAVELTSTIVLENVSAKWVRKGEHPFFGGDNIAPQFEIGYTYSDGGKTFRVEEKLVLRKWAEDELRVETF